MTLRRKRATPRRRVAPREDSAWWDAATTALLARSGHRCERCGHPLDGWPERHHRQRRTVGGDRLSNILILHARCHAYITEHPAEATAAGWIVPALGTPVPDPAKVPVRLPGLSGSALWFLDDQGGRRVVP